jgi:hypothetical protein
MTSAMSRFPSRPRRKTPMRSRSRSRSRRRSRRRRRSRTRTRRISKSRKISKSKRLMRRKNIHRDASNNKRGSRAMLKIVKAKKNRARCTPALSSRVHSKMKYPSSASRNAQAMTSTINFSNPRYTFRRWKHLKNKKLVRWLSNVQK